MTVWIWDTSHFDGPISAAQMAQAKAQGIVAVTSKIAEGTADTEGTHDDTTLANARDAGIDLLGGYFIPRTNATPADQVADWVRLLNAGEPWWRDFPGFFAQIDLERWPYDNVPASVGIECANRLRDALARWTILYASHGQYGDQLAAWDGPLWNADYVSHAPGSPAQMYPGDSWAPLHGSWRGGWATYSGQQPTFLQFTSSATIAGITTCDASAFRGSADDLRALINPKGLAAMTSPDQANELLNLYAAVFFGGDSCGPAVPDGQRQPASRAGNSILDLLQYVRHTGEQTALDAHAAANRPVTVSMTAEDRTAIVADLTTNLGGATARLEAKVDELLAAIRAGAQAQAAALPQG